MKRTYCKALKILTGHYQETHSPGISATNCPALLDRQADFEFLEAKGLVSLKKDLSTGKILIATLTNGGICFFDTQAGKIKDFWMRFFSQFLSGFLVGLLVGIALAILTPMLVR